MRRVAEDVFHIPLSPRDGVNAYLLGDVVVDAGLKGGGKRLVRALQGHAVGAHALTHAHGDHVGSVDALAEALPGVEVLISTRDARLLAKDMSLDPGEPDDKLRGGYPGAKTKPTRTLEPGDMVGSLEVVASPGHTPGHVAFLDRRDGTLIAGDAYSTLGGVATPARANPRFPLVYFASWHRPTALQSARELRALEPTRLAPGHGRIVDAPGPAMDEAIAKAS
jgi:glyoxylase-like metal-dependent hydrolase (beta-lactamase superfamily II)